MKSILVLIGGGDRDAIIFQTALAAAHPVFGHLDFLHVHVGAGEAARYSHAQFASGSALRDALGQLETDANRYSSLASQHVRDLCAQASIEFRDAPAVLEMVTASYREEQDTPIERLVMQARHSDLIVMGRSKQKQGLSPQTLERIVMGCGRPVLVAASGAPTNFSGTVMVCWNEFANATRALSAATPILSKAKRVVFASVLEHKEDVTDHMDDLARRFAWNGASTEVQLIEPKGRKIPAALAASAADCGADLIVMGAYGQSRMHELVFGSWLI